MTKRIRFTDREWEYVFEILMNTLTNIDESHLEHVGSRFNTMGEVMKLKAKLWIADGRDLEDLTK